MVHNAQKMHVKLETDYVRGRGFRVCYIYFDSVVQNLIKNCLPITNNVYYSTLISCYVVNSQLINIMSRSRVINKTKICKSNIYKNNEK